MKRYYFLFVLACLIMACQSESSQSVGKTENSLDLDTFALPVLNASIRLPKSYFRTSVEEMQQKVDSSDLDSNKKKMMMDAFQRLQTGFSEAYIFSDQLQIENSIWLVKVPSYVKMSDKVAELFAKTTERKLLSVWDAMDFEVDRLERKYIDTEAAQGLKLKFRQTLEDDTKYQTQYLLSSKDKTFMVVVSSLNAEDFQAEIEAIQYH